MRVWGSAGSRKREPEATYETGDFMKVHLAGEAAEENKWLWVGGGATAR
jgi:hypothetical protein